MIPSSTLKIMPSYTLKFQNKHITTLFTAYVSILLMSVNQFSCSCKKKPGAKNADKEKREEPRRWRLYSFTSLTFLGATC